MDQKNTIRQQVDVYLTLDVDAAQDINHVKNLIKMAIDNKVDYNIAEVVDIKLYEEADIYGNSSVCDSLTQALGLALDWIAELIADYSKEEIEKVDAKWKEIQSVHAIQTASN